MTFGPGRLVVLCGLVPTLVAALLSLYRPAFLRNWEYGAYDAILRATPTRAPGGRIVIVDIDDRSLTTDRPVALAPGRDRPAHLPPARSRRRPRLRSTSCSRSPTGTKGPARRPTSTRRDAPGRPRRARLRDDVRPRRAPDRSRACCIPSASPSCGETTLPRNPSSRRPAPICNLAGADRRRPTPPGS